MSLYCTLKVKCPSQIHVLVHLFLDGDTSLWGYRTFYTWGLARRHGAMELGGLWVIPQHQIQSGLLCFLVRNRDVSKLPHTAATMDKNFSFLNTIMNATMLSPLQNWIWKEIFHPLSCFCQVFWQIKINNCKYLKLRKIHCVYSEEKSRKWWVNALLFLKTKSWSISQVELLAPLGN